MNLAVLGQTFTIKGKLLDKDNKQALIGASVALYPMPDTGKAFGFQTNEKGRFKFTDLKPLQYKLKVYYIGYKPYQQLINIINKNISLGAIHLEQIPITLDDVVIESNEVRMTQKGDTTVYNAKAYKTNPDANSEDLIKKMPGVVAQDGKIQAHGEDLKKVLVDGQEFFGDDASIALKNLPAEVVDKVQIFDKMSEQSQFTGFDDGNTDKTLNIITRSGKNSGQFGKIYAGYGTDDKYIAGGSINFFNGTQRISLIGLSNNVNQQNFSNDDLLGVLGTTGRGGPPGMRGGGRPGQSGDARNFMVGQQSGINKTNSYGLNYTNKWGQKAKLNASYFFNNSSNATTRKINRQYFIKDTTSSYYREENVSSNDNYNHRLNVKFEFNIDSMNSFIYTPRISFQNNKSDAAYKSGNASLSELLVNQNENDNKVESNGYNLSNNLLLRHRFVKKGRTLSLNLSNSINERKSTNEQQNIYFYSLRSDTAFQEVKSNSDVKTYSGNLSYTEPIGKNGNLQLSYSPSLSNSDAEKLCYIGHNELNPFSNLSNKYKFTGLTNRGGANYRLNGAKFNIMTGINLQNVDLSGDQTYPLAFTTDKRYTSILPTASLQYRFSKSKNLRVFYRSFTNIPSLGQLQSVVDNSNPMLLSTGNPELNQEYSQNITARYNSNNSQKATSFFAMINLTYTDNRITNSTIIPESDTTINYFRIRKGAQLSKPVNTNEYYNLNSFFTYGFPIHPVKCNLNVNGGLSYNHSPSYINSAKNISNTYAVRSGVFAGSNISENVDFSLSYSFNYNFVENSINTSVNNNYYNHSVYGRLNLLPWKGLVLNTDLSFNKYHSLSGTLNQEVLLWNAGIGYKFLKNRTAEIKLSVSDILNRNKSINRVVTETYVEDNEVQVLKRYLILTFTYNIKNFNLAPK